jgi:flagellar biosynthesis/type III secretory pathway M-ring protein FliF/YscJ
MNEIDMKDIEKIVDQLRSDYDRRMRLQKIIETTIWALIIFVIVILAIWLFS